MTPPNINNKTQINNVKLTDFKVGTKKAQMKSATSKSLFDSIDTNKDGVISQNELKGIVKGKVKNKDGKFVEKEYIKLKNLENGRSLVVDSNGKQWVRAHDGVILKSSYVNGNRGGENLPDKKGLATANYLAKEFNSAQKAFNAQMEKDGWAGDLADGISRAWTWATDSKNSANYVRDDLKKQKKNVQDLQKAAKQGKSQFNAKFKEIYGVNYNQQAMDKYMAEPTEENYKKAFGSKTKNIKTRVDKYNQSQDTGAVAVKTTAKVAAGVTIGIATGGVGAAALGAAALGTAAASVAIEETDALKVTDAVTKGKFKFREGTDHTKILKDAAWDGASVLAGGAVGKVAGTAIKGAGKMAVAGRAAVNVTGDVAMGAAQEYAETGQITATGVATNAVMSGVGSAVTSGVLNKGVKAVKKGFGNVADNITHKFSAKKAELPSISTSEINAGYVGGYSVNKNSKLIPHNAELIPVSDNLSVMRTDNGLAIYKNGKSYPSNICKLELGESGIIGKDAAGNNLVAMRDNTGNISVSAEKPHTEVNLTKSQNTSSAQVNQKTETLRSEVPERSVISGTSDFKGSTLDNNTSGIGMTRKVSTKVPVQELPMRENIDIGDNKVARRTNVNEIAISVKGKIPERVTIEPGTRKTITDKYGDTYIISHNSQSGKIHIQKKVDVDTPTSSNVVHNDNSSVPIRKQRTGVEPPQKTPVNKDIGELDVNSDKLIVDTSHTSPQELIDLRNSNSVRYNQLTQEAISNLRKTSPAAYNRLEKAGIITVLNSDPNASISPRLLKNIQLEAQGKSLVTKLPNGAKLSDISTHVGNGEVCSYGGKLYINNNGKAERLNLSPEKFEQLFPPVESSIINQDAEARDCWFLSQLGGQMESPSGRVNLYKRFRQEGNDIYVSYPNAPDVKFTDGRVISAPGIQTQTCDGLKMIEMTQAVHRLSTFSEGRNVKFERLYEKGTTDAVDINSKLTPTKKHWYSASKAEMNVNDLLKRLSNGQTYAYLNSQNFQSKSLRSMNGNKDEIISVLETSANNPNISISFSTGAYGGFRDSMMGGHATRITGYDGRYVYFNDQIQMGGSAIARKVPLESFFRNLLTITYTNFDIK